MFGGYRGGRGQGRGRGRGGGGGGGTGTHTGGGGYQGNNYQSNYQGGRGSRGGGEPSGPPPRLRPCGDFTVTGSCNNANCKFAHVLRLHASIDATSLKPPSSSDRRYNQEPSQQQQPVSSIAIWETGGAIKIFTGSDDGKWRLWNTQTSVKEFEHEIGKVASVEVASNHLFCGFEATPISMPGTKVGMIHAWNLASPTQPPLEFHIQTPHLPYAHNQCVTCVTVKGDKIVSGSRDGSIRLWTFEGNGFLLKTTIAGHASEVTGLQFVDNHLWSSSVDRCIRLWNFDGTTAPGECIHVIHDHSSAVTGLLEFTSPAGQQFVLSSSLDGSIKAWNGNNGECVASESHRDGVVSMALATDQKNNPILLVGLESGDIMGRNVVQTPTTPAFCLLFKLTQKYSAGHKGAVKAIREGPSSTFYTGGDDGKLLVWQIAGDLGI